MNQPITFFRQRQKNADASYSFDFESPTRIYRVSVYATKPLEESLVRSRKIDSYEIEIERILKAISPGGVLVLAYEEKGMRSFQVVPADKGDAAFSIYGALRPGSPLTLEAVNINKVLQTPLGTHLLIPVDREAEEHLRSFQDYLAWLPADLESLILYTIAKPSQEFRISQLEAKVLKSSAGTGAGTWASRLRGRFGRPVPLWPVALLLIVLMLGLNAYLFYFLHQRIDELAVSSPLPAPTAQQKIFDIAEALRGQRDENLSLLFKGHFSKLKNVGEVQKAMKKGKDRELLMLGLMKLEAFRLDSRASSLIKSVDNSSGVKDFFKAKNLDDQPEVRDRLASLACVAYGAPGFPQQGKSPALLFSDRDCASLPLEKVADGLDQLTTFVKSYSGAE